MKIWIVFSGNYEQRYSRGPAFSNIESAKLFADGSNDIEEFEVFYGTPTKVTHYQCQAWDIDPNAHFGAEFTTRHGKLYTNVESVDGVFIEERNWQSWDVLVPVLSVDAEGYCGPRKSSSYAEANGRSKDAVRKEAIVALKRFIDAGQPS